MDFLCGVNPGPRKMSSSRPRAYGPRTRHLPEYLRTPPKKRKLQISFLIELIGQEIDFVLVGRGFLICAKWYACRMTPTPTQPRKTQRLCQVLLVWIALQYLNKPSCVRTCTAKRHEHEDIDDGHLSLHTTGVRTTGSRKTGRTPISQHNRDIDHCVEEQRQNGRVEFVQELHLRTLHRNLKQLRNIHSCLYCHDQAPVVEQQRMSSTRPRTASVWSSKNPVQPSTNSEDRRRRGQGRRSNFPNRLTTARMRLPRQSATANGATTPGSSGPFPLHSGVFGPPPLFVRCSPRWFESTLTGGSLGLVLFGLPAREF